MAEKDAGKSSPKLSRFDPDPKSAVAVAEKPKAGSSSSKLKAVVVKPKAKLDDAGKGPKQFLELGANYKIAHKDGSGYSTLYKTVAEKGNFEKVSLDLDAGKYDPNDRDSAAKLLEKMMVPIDKLEEWCRADSSWHDHSKKKTATLTQAAGDGDKAAKNILKNDSRCLEGEWTGNVSEMFSTNVGYYSWIMRQRYPVDGEKPEPEPNKNVLKFQEAGIVFRRYPLQKSSEAGFVMMYPEKHIDAVCTAILVAMGVNEEEYWRGRKPRKSKKKK